MATFATPEAALFCRQEGTCAAPRVGIPVRRRSTLHWATLVRRWARTSLNVRSTRQQAIGDPETDMREHPDEVMKGLAQSIDRLTAVIDRADRRCAALERSRRRLRLALTMMAAFLVPLGMQQLSGARAQSQTPQVPAAPHGTTAPPAAASTLVCRPDASGAGPARRLPGPPSED